MTISPRPFIGFRDLTDNHAAKDVEPWAWAPPAETLAALTAAKKASRTGIVKRLGWLIYSPVRGRAPMSFVEAANPAAGVRGMVLDYDVPLDQDRLTAALAKVPEDLAPQWVEVSLSGNFRLVWCFGREIPVPDDTYLSEFWGALAARIGAQKLYAGLDPASLRPIQRWTAGKEWLQYSEHSTVPQATIDEVLWATAAKWRSDARGEVSLTAVAEEIEKRWPGAWGGDFAIGAKGRRFWDPKADNPAGCMVKADGFVCFTGPKPSMSWEALLGDEWTRKARASRLEEATAGIWFDGRAYWHQSTNGIWRPRTREDTSLELQTRGFDVRVPRGATVSECGRVLNFLQTQRRVDAAVSLVNYPPGPINMRGAQVLNICRTRALQPAESGDASHWPWIHEFLQGHFARPEERPLDHFLAWLQRAYRGLLEHRQDMGQALFLCGPRQNGKTLLALRIVAPLLGNTYADPFEYLTGRTSFNAELFDSYLWVLNDADSPRDNEKGSVLSKIKDTVVNPTHQFHRKFGDRAQVDWQGRLLITLNDDPASVGLLPEVNSNTADKLCFFASQMYAKPWPSAREIESTITRELPHFARWLLDWSAPVDVLEQSRVGVKSYFDSAVLETSRRQNYAYNFRELLASWVTYAWGAEEAELVATPTDLMSRLTICDPVAALAREWKVSAAARALTALARDPSSGVTHAGEHRRTFRVTRNVLS